MFELVMYGDRISDLQAKRTEIIAGLRDLPEKIKDDQDEPIIYSKKQL